ncbi:dihydroorotate dehydrogenase (quinone) [Candidatus Roizmanbacteria bacterium RIFCSPLOWO2_01_FULL_37_13]|uniref:Dihydroorotate dehydrogenase (quinone) n=1 Tax=Candidatus Roizmanbacteria bacterium RIFCSPHIGHO2_02_FULL_38_11 TaxID=1802039 RepID=A0A1F7GWF6_9BACT|nr:MAG: dihydroorotate dehydrogenase (quinone) [Candidatus Roizmanbacteria bacterium RIFCSPHIGHO2_02_FULL_38_11]OGK41555.1 MAG: dihydroorotate dehydrogenase (quinone) [Candidatus Roizmanbacteria bacterium RIFCSPLOWO2_01_FULL_37_13]
MKQKVLVFILVLVLLGIIDSGYLTYEHYAKTVPPCSTSIFIDCGKVLRSKYAVMFGIPLAVIGVIHYGLLTIFTLFAWVSHSRPAKGGVNSSGNLFNWIPDQVRNDKLWKYFVVIQSTVGAFASVYFMYLQLGVIGSICLYCTFSAIISFIIFGLAMIFLRKEKKELALVLFAIFYQKILKNIFFLIDAEIIHESMLSTGEILGNIFPVKYSISRLTKYKDSSLKQKISSINFETPVGLAAGFDYEAKLPLITPALGFGLQTIGTITNMPYEGNPKPRLGRLPKSKSLMVNKGFKNEGALQIVKRLEGLRFDIPIGISIGRTNSPKLPTLKQSIEDIVECFIKLQTSNLKHSYYELNISCPNIIHGSDITFYPPKNLKTLLAEVEKLRINKPVFVKMPIEKSDRETFNMLDVISKYKIAGVIIGNLQKNRKDPELVQEEVKKFKVGNFSGKPTFNRSNELIKLAYKKFGKKLVIVGCGGIFNADDAYTKIKLGASLLQLITGLVYQGPQLITQINYGLIDRLKEDGFKNIKDAVGIEV